MGDGETFLPTTLNTAAPDPVAGTVIAGRYRVIEPIGAGGMGRVYRGQQLGKVEPPAGPASARAPERRQPSAAPLRPVAVKLLYSSMEQNVLALKRFENEARVVGQLRHPNTVRLVDAGRTEDGRLFLVTELLLGTRLDRVMADRRMGVLEIVRILSQICGSLSEAHAKKIVHRDLKPSNVFLERVGREDVVKVLDFGIAKLLDGPAITRPMTVVGTPGFMSPEQGAGKPLDGRSDLYALGAIAYECLAGRPPHVAEGKVALLVLQLSEPAPPLAPLVGPEVPAELISLVMRLLEHDPAKRPATADQLRAELDRIALTLAAQEAIAASDRTLPGARSSDGDVHGQHIQHETTTELGAPERSVAFASLPFKTTWSIILMLLPLLLIAAAVWLYYR